MQTRKKRRLAAISTNVRGLDDDTEEKPAAQNPAAAIVSDAAVGLYQLLLSSATQLSQLQGGFFGDGRTEESVTFNLKQQTTDSGFKLQLQGTRTRWRDLPEKIASAQQQLLLQMDKRRQDMAALEAKSASLCLLMEKSTDEEQKQLGDELYCVRRMIGRHKAELQELQRRGTLEVEAGVERETSVLELSVSRKASAGQEVFRCKARPARLYVVGGCGAAQAVCTKRLGVTFCYDAQENKWTRRSELAQPRAHPACAAVGKFLYVMGGMGDGGRLRDVDRLDTSQPGATWEPLPALPRACVGSVALALGHRIYLLGGSTEANFLGRVLAFDTILGAWSESEPMSKERGYPGGCVLNDSLYVFGGRSDRDEVLAHAERYRPGDGWSAVAPLKVGRWGCAAAVLNGKLYAIGGLNAKDQVLDSVERYDPDLNAWSLASDLPVYLTRAACAVAG